MSYATGTAASMNALMTALKDFAVADSWTQDQLQLESGGGTHGKLSLSKGTVFVHFSWNSTLSDSIAMYQSLGFIAAGTDIWDHTDDSGQGTASVPQASGDWLSSQVQNNRFIRLIGAGPYTSYSFHSPSSGPDYIHIALEYAPGTYRHFGFGTVEKTTNWAWTGGEYCYAHTFTDGESQEDPILLGSYRGFNMGADSFPSLHIEGMVEQTGSMKWGIFLPTISALSATYRDRALNNQIRIDGSAPGGLIGTIWNNLPSNSGDGFLPVCPNMINYHNVTDSPESLYPLGKQPDIFTLNMKSFAAKDEATIGGDTYIIYPGIRKQNIGSTDESQNLGIAYKKVV